MVEREDGPRPTAAGVHTFLLADVRGYTRFTMEQGDEAAARLVGMLADLSEDVVMRYGGAVIELRGDEVLAIFTSTRQALRAALELQARFAADIEGWSTPVGLGIGLDAGEAIPIKGGYRGAALNLAARLCSLAAPGEVLVSDTVVNLARRTEGLDYAERGFVDFKGLSDPVHVFQIRLAPGKARDSQQRAIGSTGSPILLDGFRTRVREHLRGAGGRCPVPGAGAGSGRRARARRSPPRQEPAAGARQLRARADCCLAGGTSARHLFRSHDPGDQPGPAATLR